MSASWRACSDVNATVGSALGAGRLILASVAGSARLCGCAACATEPSASADRITVGKRLFVSLEFVTVGTLIPRAQAWSGPLPPASQPQPEHERIFVRAHARRCRFLSCPPHAG